MTKPEAEKQVNISLSQEDYDMLIAELYSLFSYHWNDDHTHADDCGSKVLHKILEQGEQ